MKVKFENVGRNKETWISECKGELTEKFLYDQVKYKLISKDIKFYISKDNPNKGKIIAGFYEVGTFIINNE